MSAAFLALWNDYPATLTEEYEVWHTFEHVPERLTTPGMLWARRYADFSKPDNRYFTLYALDNLEVLEQPAYLELVRQPTDWSLSMRQHFLNVLRIPGISFTHGGNGVGGGLIAQAYSVGRLQAPAASQTLAKVLEELTRSGRILGFRIVIAEPNQPYEVFEQADVTDPDTLNVIVMVEGTTKSALAATRGFVSEKAQRLLQPELTLRDGLFSLLVNYQGGEFASDRKSLTASETLRSQFSRSPSSEELQIPAQG